MMNDDDGGGWNDDDFDDEEIDEQATTSSAVSNLVFIWHLVKWPLLVVAVNIGALIVTLITYDNGYEIDSIRDQPYGRQEILQPGQNENEALQAARTERLVNAQDYFVLAFLVWSILLTIDAVIVHRGVKHVQKQWEELCKENPPVSSDVGEEQQDEVEMQPLQTIDAPGSNVEEGPEPTVSSQEPVTEGEGVHGTENVKSTKQACCGAPKPPELLCARVSARLDGFLSSGAGGGNAANSNNNPKSSTILIPLLHLVLAVLLAGAILLWVHTVYLASKPVAFQCGDEIDNSESSLSSGRHRSNGLESLILTDPNIPHFSKAVENFLKLPMDPNDDYGRYYGTSFNYVELADHSLYFVGLEAKNVSATNDISYAPGRQRAISSTKMIMTEHSTLHGIRTFKNIVSPSHMTEKADKNGFCFLTQYDPRESSENGSSSRQNRGRPSNGRDSTRFLGCRSLPESFFRHVSLRNEEVEKIGESSHGYWDQMSYLLKFSDESQDAVNNGMLWIRREGTLYSWKTKRLVRVSSFWLAQNRPGQDLTLVRFETSIKHTKDPNYFNHSNDTYSGRYWWECMVVVNTVVWPASLLVMSSWLWWKKHSPAGSAALVLALPLWSFPIASAIVVVAWAGVSLWLLVVQRKRQSRERLRGRTESLPSGLQLIFQTTLCNRTWLVWSHHAALTASVFFAVPVLLDNEVSFFAVITAVILECTLSVLLLGYPMLQIAGFPFLALAGIFGVVGIVFPPLFVTAVYHLIIGAGLCAVGSFVQKYRVHIRVLSYQYYHRIKGVVCALCRASSRPTSDRSS